jgi:hypothetical protein
VSALRASIAIAALVVAHACAQTKEAAKPEAASPAAPPPAAPPPAAPSPAAPPPAATPAPSAVAPSGPLVATFGWFAELAGSCWKGDYPDGTTSDTQCYLAQYEHLLRGSIKMYRAGSPQPTFEGDAVFSRDTAGSGKVIYTQWGSGGIYATGEIAFEGDTLVFRNRQPETGELAQVRAVWRRTGPDSYRVTRERSDDSVWREFLVVDYRRLR